jgi:hypothetical protein
MNSSEMFKAIDSGSKLNLDDYAKSCRDKKVLFPTCNVADLLLSMFLRSADADRLIAALDDAEKRIWGARRAAELRRDYEQDNPTDVTRFDPQW